VNISSKLHNQTLLKVDVEEKANEALEIATILRFEDASNFKRWVSVFGKDYHPAATSVASLMRKYPDQCTFQ
jgi:hypothetical protein